VPGAGNARMRNATEGVSSYAIEFIEQLIMMGHHARSEALFYYFRLEDNIPENDVLRLIAKAYDQAESMR
jgi:hypothetical protein